MSGSFGTGDISNVVANLLGSNNNSGSGAPAAQPSQGLNPATSLNAILAVLQQIRDGLLPPRRDAKVTFSNLQPGTTYRDANGAVPSIGNVPVNSIIITVVGNLASVAIWLSQIDPTTAAEMPPEYIVVTGGSSQQLHFPSKNVGNVTIYNNSGNPISGTIELMQY